MNQKIILLYKLVKSFCRKWNIYDTEIVQDLVWNIYSKLDKFDSTKGKFSTFVYFNCKHYYLQMKSKKKHIVSFEELSSGDKEFVDSIQDERPTPLEKLLRDELETFLNNNCSDITREYLEGKKQKDIAKEHGIPYPTCNQRIHRELKKLKEAYCE